MVNGAFLVRMRDGLVVERPSLCFGGLDQKVTRATETEEFIFRKGSTTKGIFKDQVCDQ